MHILVVYAHPDPKSFNHALAVAVLEEVQKKGHSHVFRNLYELQFHPVLSCRDFEDFNHGDIPEDIKAEQMEIKRADVIIFVHPIWWFGMPAILKGWVDRVFSYGFAYGNDSRGVRGLLAGKKAVVINTTGGDQKSGYMDTGYQESFLNLTDHGIYSFVGLDVILHRFFYQVPILSQEGRLEMIESLRDDLRKIL